MFAVYMHPNVRLNRLVKSFTNLPVLLGFIWLLAVSSCERKPDPREKHMRYAFELVYENVIYDLGKKGFSDSQIDEVSEAFWNNFDEADVLEHFDSYADD